METFEVYYEKFSLNPLNWKRDFLNMLFRKQIKEREAVRKNTHKHMRELNAILKKINYSIHKHDRDYSSRTNRKIGLSNAKNNATKYIVGPLSKIPYVRVLFTKAHEVAHALQWDETTGKKYFFDAQLKRVMNAKTREEAVEIEDVNMFWNELDAWARGLTYIPNEFKVEYKKYAQRCYKSYQDYPVDYYAKNCKQVEVLLYMLDPANTQY